MKDALEVYLQEVASKIKRGDAREETFYPALENLVKTAAVQTGQKQTDVTTLPKQTEAGNLDFRVWDGSHNITGYIEAKVPDTGLNKNCGVGTAQTLPQYIS